MQKSTTENLVFKLSKIKREPRTNYSSGTRSISPPKKLPLALSFAPLEKILFQETMVARLPRRPSEQSVLASFAGFGVD